MALKNDKPARPFGAPVSDAEDDDDEADGDNDDEDGAETSEKEKDDVDKDDSKSTADDGKAAKYKKGTLILFGVVSRELNLLTCPSVR